MHGETGFLERVHHLCMYQSSRSGRIAITRTDYNAMKWIPAHIMKQGVIYTSSQPSMTENTVNYGRVFVVV